MVMLMMEVDSDLVSRKECYEHPFPGQVSFFFSQLLHCSIANWFRISQMEYLCKYKRLFPYTLLEDYLVVG